MVRRSPAALPPAVAGIVSIVKPVIVPGFKHGQSSVRAAVKPPIPRFDPASFCPGYTLLPGRRTPLEIFTARLTDLPICQKALTLRQLRPLGHKLHPGPHGKHSFPAGMILELIGDRYCIFPGRQQDFLFHFHACCQKIPDRIILEGNACQPPVSLLFSSVCKALAGQGVGLLPHGQPLLQPVDHVVPVIGRHLPVTADEHPMVVSGAGARHGKRGEASQTIGHQIAVLLSPLQRFKILSSIDKFHNVLPCPFPGQTCRHCPRIMPLTAGTLTFLPALFRQSASCPSARISQLFPSGSVTSKPLSAAL